MPRGKNPSDAFKGRKPIATEKKKKTSSEMTDAEYDNFLKTGEAPDADTPESKKEKKSSGLRGVFEKRKKIEKDLFGG